MNKVTISMTVEFRSPDNVSEEHKDFVEHQNARDFTQHVKDAVGLFCEARYGEVNDMSIDNRRV